MLHEALQRQLRKAKALHEEDLEAGLGEVALPYALARKYPNAGYEWGWQYVLPSTRRSIDPRSGLERRHHLSVSVVQKAVKRAVRRAGIAKPGSKAQAMTNLIDPAIDWCALAKGMGVPSQRPDSAESFHKALERAVEEDGPHLIEAIV